MKELAGVIVSLEDKGYDVHFPPRDTDQKDPTGKRICTDNVNAIRNSDVVFIVYDTTSRGSLFDLGAAFTLNKPLVILNRVETTEGKSFANMITDWAANGLE